MSIFCFCSLKLCFPHNSQRAHCTEWTSVHFVFQIVYYGGTTPESTEWYFFNLDLGIKFIDWVKETKVAAVNGLKADRGIYRNSLILLVTSHFFKSSRYSGSFSSLYCI